MNKQLVLVGVPVKTHYALHHKLLDPWDNYGIIVSNYYEEYVPGYTKETLEFLTKQTKKAGVNIINQGELILKHDEKGVPDIDDLILKGKEVREKHKNSGRIICIGSSHLGALVLYEDNDIVARFDFHGDYDAENSKVNLKKNNVRLTYNLTTYMNAVEDKFKNVDVVNYGVQKMSQYGETGVPEEKKYLQANHFDMDLDVFDRKYDMNDSEGKSYFKVPEVHDMLCQAKPRKIGVWEYRPEDDLQSNALNFILSLAKVPI